MKSVQLSNTMSEPLREGGWPFYSLNMAVDITKSLAAVLWELSFQHMKWLHDALDNRLKPDK